ncbi:MAG: hypothetical protein A3F26_03730 [Candidatus Ryanbacteria bacterium RIFCSPHIGHO2_12_FULL_47_12b]|uniref:N-acetyltransferase domain-containing protein n=2 Tax=Candidatus Ryaniibacteriota TaxID=1817914 RepID=A0A1G2H323_9BACT|nr:MAG: hypothetical protein A3C83_00220 [Candidatus Ryanbacteria bacterium RIFCSPHIGHO2_02_FULL_47_25]OGZ52199.1 MAG: hypothetical protein A3A29_02800 [Candidatus Ryanbacteria bacterium RIFCSPLOWO2_01_FULL_47_79]OGZ52869.1 MAG: hypothetical protein A3F26_03730 [Candidatus Ryanbacteria bacterium RIFCSPHIGHO2_12_FULL_47_12b]OGZ56790.1 MAG: hypothetical protein A3J04_03150 [Candidatus Ryanbacteria bacterium RIFCSPLOWO2_02_FULL_47_14]OGZ56872.1 MAG: hypothetical protein A3G60_03155 [Candidatus Rya
MGSRFSYQLDRHGADYVLSARVRVDRRNRKGKIVGEAMFCFLPDGERVELVQLFTKERHGILLAPKLLRQFERLVRRSERLAVWLEATTEQGKFYAEHGYQIITEHGKFLYMQKSLE